VPVLYTYDDRQRKRSLGGIRSLAFAPDSTLLAVGGMGQVGNVDGLGGLATIEVWDWRKPQKRLAAEAQGHKGFVNALVFHPREPWLLGVGGGSDNGFLAFWKADNLAAQRVKTDGHLHRCSLSTNGRELYVAGYHKFEVWSLGV
jgi:WD40 repeat protein